MDQLELVCGELQEAPDCSSLVVEIEDCSVAWSRARMDLAASLPPCEDLSLGDLNELEIPLPQECLEVRQNCPEAAQIIFRDLVTDPPTG